MAEIEDSNCQIEQAETGHARDGHPPRESVIDRGTGERPDEGESGNSEAHFRERVKGRVIVVAEIVRHGFAPEDACWEGICERNGRRSGDLRSVVSAGLRDSHQTLRQWLAVRTPTAVTKALAETSVPADGQQQIDRQPLKHRLREFEIHLEGRDQQSRIEEQQEWLEQVV